MKYVWILVAVVLLVRIDLVLKFFDKAAKQVETTTAPDVVVTDVTSGSELVSMADDLAIKSKPRQNFISMLNNFQSSPDATSKISLIEFLKAHPTMYSDVLDADLEAAIYRLRNLIIQRNKETPELLLEIMKMLKGENLQMVRRFFSFMIDVDIVDFLTVYSKSSDVNCTIITYLGDSLPIEERLNELSERLVTLENYLNSENVSLIIKPYGDRCYMVLKMEVEKMRTSFEPEEAAAPVTDPGIVP